MRKICESLPGSVPEQGDIPDAIHHKVTALIDFSAVISPLVNGKGLGSRNTEEWSPRWKGELGSAICGGQWPQVRKAAVPKWNIQDSSCQLCVSATGTLDHRFQCPTTRPSGGWPAPPPVAQSFLNGISDRRRQLLRTRGLLPTSCACS